MGPDITQCEILRNSNVAAGGMVSGFALRKMRAMERNGLTKARKRAGLTQPAIAERMGVSVPQVSRWETGKDGIPSQRLPALVAAYEAPLEELLGEGVPESNGTILRYEGASDVVLPKDVPIFGTTLGAPRDFDGVAVEQTMLNSGEVIGYLPRPTVLNGQRAVYGLYVQGSSMAPRHEDGETVFVQDSRQGRPPRIGDDVVVYLVDPDDETGERAAAVLLKRLKRRTSAFIELGQFNPEHTFKIEQAKVLRVDRVIPWSELLS